MLKTNLILSKMKYQLVTVSESILFSRAIVGWYVELYMLLAYYYMYTKEFSCRRPQPHPNRPNYFFTSPKSSLKQPGSVREHRSKFKYQTLNLSSTDLFFIRKCSRYDTRSVFGKFCLVTLKDTINILYFAIN